MRDTAVQRSYVGSAAALSHHGLSPARGSTGHRPGFTLIELVVAAAILFILIFGLASVFARGVTGFKQAQLLTMAQNLAEFQVEDLKNLAPSVLNQLVFGEDADPPVGYQDVNYPYPSRNATADNYDATARANDDFPWMYDSGKLQTDFKVDGVEKLLKDRIDDSMVYHIDLPEFEAKVYATEIGDVAIPTEDQILLGDNIVVEVYADDLLVDRRYWYDYDTPGWYYLWVDADGETQRTYVTLTNPANMLVYYHITLQKEAYPLFSRQVRIAQYDADAPGDFKPFDITETDYRTFQGGTHTKFEYEITIWYKQNGVDRVLFRSGGTIAWPFTSVNVDRRTA